MLNKKVHPHVKVIEVRSAEVGYFKEIRTETLFYPFESNTYFVIREQDQLLAKKTIGELLKNYGYSFEMDRPEWAIKGKEISSLFKSNIHPSIYEALIT